MMQFQFCSVSSGEYFRAWASFTVADPLGAVIGDGIAGVRYRPFDGGEPMRQSRPEIATYIAEVCRELSVLAAEANMPVLAYLLSMAILQADREHS